MPLQTVEAPFGEWLPDQPDYKNPGLLTANNVLPTAGGYKPFPKLSGQGDTITGVVKGSRYFRRSDDTVILVGGTGTDLFVLVGGTVTASSLSLTVADGSYWQFEQFGDYVVAVCPGQSTYYLTDIDTDTSWSALTGTPPKALTIGRVGDFLMLGNLTDIDSTSQPYRVRWSAFNDPTATWGTDRGTQADFVDMPHEYGTVTAIRGGRYDMVFQQFGISRISYVGGTTVFAKELIEEKRGCIAPPSAVSVGSFVFFLAHDGFHVTNGATTQPLSSRKVTDWFLEAVDDGYIGRTQGAVDWANECVVWSFYDSGAGSYTRQLVYSWRENRWTTADVATYWLTDAAQSGTTLEDLDALFPNGLETVTPNLDSEYWKSRARVFSAWIKNGSSSEIATFSGAAREATIETGEFQPAPGRRIYVTGATPLVENSDGDTTISIGARSQTKGATRTYSTPTSPGADGMCPQRVDGRYVTARMIIPADADWTKASGVQAKFRVSGVR